jgi:hypothetical protein
MISALVNLTTKKVENLIVADPDVDEAPEGFALIADPPQFVAIGCGWNGAEFDPPLGTGPAPITPGLKVL